ncbi:YceI family protein [Roseibium salinum]|nr:YceI family protein [Roseibium salinum]
MIRRKSTLGFEVTQGDGTVEGVFSTWDATIDFDPQAPETARISAEIQPMSAATGNPQFDGTLPGKDWFDAGAFPSAEFKSEKRGPCRRQELPGGRYVDH